MVTTRAELQSVREKMQDEVQRIISDLTNEVAVARARERELQNNMARAAGRCRAMSIWPGSSCAT